MTNIFGHSYGKRKFEILKRGVIYYVYLDSVQKLRADNEVVCRSYIDGFIDGLEAKWTNLIYLTNL